jgi:enamine deaminase RidA (YjgF/YER057c/UK114 family)
MNNLNLEIAYYYTKEESSFAEAVKEILLQLNFGIRTPVRFVFFGTPQSCSNYYSELAILKEKIAAKYGAKSPVISYVSQKPLCNNSLVLEAHSIEISTVRDIQYHQFENNQYITIEDKKSKNLSIGGIFANNFETSIFEQSSKIFETIKKILDKEEMPISSIVRQWNYIAQITCVQKEKQHYQEFNDARSHFYNQTNWPSGYPAATGIGTERGGVVVDLFAVKSKCEDVMLFPLDNQLQVAAHAYSQSVLIGLEDKEFKTRTTPKFERGKVVHSENHALVYISGTAAIRGEGSLALTDIKKQTLITLENIEELISSTNLMDAGVKEIQQSKIKSLRIYLKTADYYQIAKMVVDRILPDVPAVYLRGDICRDNLLIEIEGIAGN